MLRSFGKFVLAGVAAVLLASSLPAQADDEVRIGLLFDVTGPVANFVPPMLDAAKLAIDQVNAQCGILGGRGRGLADIGRGKDELTERDVAHFAAGGHGWGLPVTGGRERSLAL